MKNWFIQLYRRIDWSFFGGKKRYFVYNLPSNKDKEATINKSPHPVWPEIEKFEIDFQTPTEYKWLLKILNNHAEILTLIKEHLK